MDKERLKMILERRASLNHDDSFGIYKCWEEIVKILTENENETIKYLSSCKEEELYFISEVFEDISFEFQSGEFIVYLRELDSKYPDLDMTVDIDYAQKILK